MQDRKKQQYDAANKGAKDEGKAQLHAFQAVGSKGPDEGSDQHHHQEEKNSDR